MDKSGIINLKGELRDYTKFYLVRNPFPSLTIPDETPSITADREEPIRRFKDAIIELTKNNVTSVAVTVGEYGSGKSHLFRIFKQAVNTQLLSTKDGTLAVFVRSPGNDFSDLLFAFVDDIGRSLFTQYATVILNDFINKNKENVKHYISKHDVRKEFENGNISLETFMIESEYINLNKEIRNTKFAEIKDDDLVFAFLSLAHPEFGAKAWKWLLGGSLDKSESNSINVSKAIKEPAHTFSIFEDLVKILHIVGIKSLVILVDELEKITFLGKTPREDYQDTLRHWIDSYPKNVCFYFAIAPHQWDNLVKEPTALIRRLSGSWYVLKPFEEENTSELIERYLDSTRTDEYPSKDIKKKFPKCEPDLFPFTNESITTIQQESKGIVSNILLLCRRCLEYLYDEVEKYKVVTPELVSYVSQKEGFDK